MFCEGVLLLKENDSFVREKIAAAFPTTRMKVRRLCAGFQNLGLL
jgi:hypothetical protein